MDIGEYGKKGPFRTHAHRYIQMYFHIGTNPCRFNPKANSQEGSYLSHYTQLVAAINLFNSFSDTEEGNISVCPATDPISWGGACCPTWYRCLNNNNNNNKKNKIKKDKGTSFQSWAVRSAVIVLTDNFDTEAGH